MFMMVVKICGVWFFLLFFIESSLGFVVDKNSKLFDFDSQCDTICLGSGGGASFNGKNKICNCTMNKNIHAADPLLLEKNALNMGLEDITFLNLNGLEKRDIGDSFKHNHNGILAGKLSTQPKLDLSKFISGARSSTLPKKTSFTPKQKLEFPSAKKAKIDSSDFDLKERLKIIHNRLREKMEGLTWKLPKLKQRAAFKEASKKPIIDLQKIKEEERKKWGLWDLKSKNNIIGQPTPKIPQTKTETVTNIDGKPNKPLPSNDEPLMDFKNNKPQSPTSNINVPQNSEPQLNQFPKSAIITQPRELYEGDDDDDDGNMR